MWWFGLWLACVEEPGGLGPPVVLEVSDEARSEVARSGQVLVTAFDPSTQENWVLLVGAAGETVWALAGDPGQRFLRARLSEDGETLLTVSNDPTHRSHVGQIVRRTFEGEVHSITDAAYVHHDFVEQDGAFAHLEHVTTQAVIGSMPGLRPVTSDAVRITPEGAVIGGPTLFSFFEDYSVDPWWVCDHMELGTWVPDVHEWTHSNSLVAHPTDDAWFVMPRYLNAILKIDGQTGEVLWQLGGRDGTLTLGEGAAFDHGHFSHAFDDRLLVFDNGDGHDKIDVASRVVELQVDEATGSVERVWEYTHPDGSHTNFLGDARRLPGGNTLIAWPQDHRITEVTPGGDTVWSVRIGEWALGRITYVSAEDHYSPGPE